MFGWFKRKEKPLLRVLVNGEEICNVSRDEIPCDKQPSRQLDAGSVIEFIDHSDNKICHQMAKYSGWFHFSVRVHPNMACQADCAITQEEKYDQAAFSKGEAIGIRFQPFFISGADVDNSVFTGKGLFKRGLHFQGNVTNGGISLSCECEYCRKSFLINSFHAGFSNSGYFYSSSGDYTLSVSDDIPGCPATMSVPNPIELAALEAQLPMAPDGTTFKYTNAFRCPHCKRPYIDFLTYPEERTAEYYGNYFAGKEVLRYQPVD
jgi:hypothetical protein